MGLPAQLLIAMTKTQSEEQSTEFEQIEVGDSLRFEIEEVDMDGNKTGDIVETTGGVAEVEHETERVLVKCGGYKVVTPAEFVGIDEKGKY